MSALRQQIEQANTAAVEVIVHEAQEIATISADYLHSTGQRKTTLLKMINERLDELIETMMGVFTTTVDLPQMEAALSEHHPLTETRMKRLDPGVVPLVVIRELLSVHKMPVKRASLRNWSDFADRYHAFV